MEAVKELPLFVYGTLSESSTLHLLSLIAAIAIAGIAGLAIERLLISPLAKVPGPKIAALTQWWMIYHEFNGDRTVTIHKLHEKYGPIVRVSPTEVSFNNPEGVKDIYGAGSQFPKSHFYDLFMYYGERNMFTTLTKKEHGDRKKMITDRYSKSYVMQPAIEASVQARVEEFMAQIKESRILDMYMHLHYYALDCITNHLFGRYGTRSLSNQDDRYLVDDLSGVKHRPVMYRWIYFRPLMEFITSLKSIGSIIFQSKAPHHARGARVRDYGWNSVQSFKKTEKGTEEGKLHTAGKLFGYDGTDLALRETQIASECMDHLVAGVDTTGDTLCFTMWSLSRPEYAHVQQKLHQELKSIEFPANGVPSIQKLDSLPYLDAIIKEGLRLFAAIPMTLFREVPAEGKVMSGYSLPGGTIVGSQAYSLHRNEEIYPNPGEFIPERWLNVDKETELQMQRQFWAFSSGARSCIGQKSSLLYECANISLAMVEMKILLAAIYIKYKTVPGPGCTVESMAFDDQITSAVPYAQKCMMEFHER